MATLARVPRLSTRLMKTSAEREEEIEERAEAQKASHRVQSVPVIQQLPGFRRLLIEIGAQ